MTQELTTQKNKSASMLAGLACAALLGWIYYPTFVWMVDRWNAADSYFAHGFIIPIVSVFWVWQKRAVLKQTPKEGSYAGLPIVVLAALIQIFASVFRVYFISAFAFVLLLAGAVIMIYGKKIFKEIWFPIMFLLLMIPLPLLAISEMTLKLKFLVTEMAIFALNHTGITAHREGSYLILPDAFLLIGDPCSGLRSFLAFLCLGFIFAYGGKLSPLAKITLVAVGLPLAILSNLLRVYALGIIAWIYGQEAAGGKIHDASGFVVFAIAFGCFMLIRHKLESHHVRA